MTDTSKHILISGSTSALAGALIEAARERSEYVLLSVSSSEPVTVSSHGFSAHHHISGIDLIDESCLDKLDGEIRSFFKQSFHVVHFAGDFWRHKPLLTTDYAEIRAMMNSHFLSLCGVAKAVTPTLMRVGGGRLVAFSCNSVEHNYPDMSPFTSSKAAVESFIRCYANEYSHFGISSTAIALPTMRTSEVLREKPQGDHENYIDPKELANFILDHVLLQPTISTGNVIRLMKPSPTFYGQGYFERNPRREEDNKALEATATSAAGY